MGGGEGGDEKKEERRTRRMWEVHKWLYDVSLEERWMTLLTPLNKTELM